MSGLAPATGTIRFRGRDLLASPPSSRSGRGVARTFQDMGLVRGDSVRETRRNLETYLAAIPETLKTTPASEAALLAHDLA